MNKVIGFQGIVRNLSDTSAQPGAMQEVINMRLKDGSWRPVGKKVVDEPGVSDERYMHRVSSYILIRVSLVEVSEDTLEVYYRIDIDGVPGSILKRTNLIVSDQCVFSSLGNVLAVSDSVNEVTHLLLFSDETQEYKVYESVNGSTLLPQLPSFFIYSEPYADPEFSPYSWVGGSNISISDANSYNDMLTGEYLKYKSKGEEAGYLSGYVLMVLAWELIDGSVVMHSVPTMVKTSELRTEGFTDGTMRCTTYFNPSKLSIIFYIDSTDLTTLLGKYKGLIKGVNVYTTMPKAPGIEDVDIPVGVDDVKKIRKRKTWAAVVAATVDPWIGGALLRRAKKTKKIYYDVDKLEYHKPNVEDDTNYFLLTQIPIEKIVANTPYWSNNKTELDLEDISNLSTSEMMPLNEFSHHGLYTERIFQYNQRFFYGKIKNYLYKDIDPRMFHLALIPGDTQYIGPQYRIALEVDLAVSSNKTCTIFSGFFTHAFMKTYGDPSFSTVKFYFGYLPGITYSPAGISVTGNDNYIGYPDARAREMRLLISFDAGVTMKLVETFNLKNVDLINMAVCTGKLIEKNISSMPVYTLSSNPSSYYDTDRIQACELNNPFHFPAINSYQLQGDVIGMATNAVALSQGQFGQYPVICFTSKGIWALEIGGGETLISRIVPLAREVCNNPDSILGIDGGIVFTTERGLNILSGPKVVELSKSVDGQHESILREMTSYQESMDNPNIYELAEYLCQETFNTFIQGAKIGYDYLNKELIICNHNHPYSFVYSFDSQAWFKISETFSRFIADYPVMYGYHMVSDVLCRVNITDEDSVNLQEIHFETRPVRMAAGYIKILRMLFDAFISDSNDNPFSVCIFGSTDKVNWILLNSSSHFLAQKNIILGRATFSVRYFIVVAGGKAAVDNSYVNGLLIDYEERYGNKLR